MTYEGSASLLICSSGVRLVAAAFGYLNTVAREKDKIRVPFWAIFAACIQAGIAAFALRATIRNQVEILNTMPLTTAMLAGITVKWCAETVAQKKPTIHEEVLCGTLLIAPLAVAAGGGVFGSQPTVGTLLLWYFNGFFWHAALSDVELLATKESMIVRRREPPYPAAADNYLKN